MKTLYLLDSKEIAKVKARLAELRNNALLCRDARDMEANREFYLRAKGFEEALMMLGIYTDKISGNTSGNT